MGSQPVRSRPLNRDWGVDQAVGIGRLSSGARVPVSGIVLVPRVCLPVSLSPAASKSQVGWPPLSVGLPRVRARWLPVTLGSLTW